MSSDDWAGDLCTCGHRRDGHKPGRRRPWPLGPTPRGACLKACMCTAWEIDAGALDQAEAARRAARAITAETDPRLHAMIHGRY